MTNTSSALRTALLTQPPPATVRVSVDEPEGLSLAYVRDGEVEYFVETPLREIACDPERLGRWAAALARMFHLSRDEFYTHPQVIPALLSRAELVTEADFAGAMVDFKYCERADEALDAGFDAFGAVRAGNDLALRDLLDRDPALVSTRNEDGDRLLHVCAGTPPDTYGPGDVGAVLRLLLDRGADVRAAQRGDAVLHVSLPWAVPALVAAGARFDVEDAMGRTPLGKAREECDDELVEALLRGGATA